MKLLNVGRITHIQLEKYYYLLRNVGKKSGVIKSILHYVLGEEKKKNKIKNVLVVSILKD